MGGEAPIEILLVEDSDADAEMTLRALRKGNVANAVTRVHDGAEALEFLFSTGQYLGRPPIFPRMILLDVKMPKVGGLEVLRALKADERTKSIPVIMLTSSAEGRDVADCYKAGVNSYLVKPVDIRAFSELIMQTGSYWITMNRSPSRS